MASWSRSRSLSAVCAAFLFLAAPHAHALGSGFVSDDFDRVNLDPARWTFVNPLGDGQVAMVGAGSGDARVVLSLPAGTPHDAWGAGGVNEAPRIVQAVSDADFELEVRFEAEPTGSFNDQGVVVAQDANNQLRFDVYHSGAQLRAFIGRRVAGSNSTVLNAAITPGTATYLRVRRTGDTFELDLSGNGTSWTTAGSTTVALVVGEVGVYAANPVNGASYSATIDYVFETASPVVPEDGGAPADVLSPLIHSVSATPGLGQLTVDWFTDEPSLGTVEYGETLAYELGSVSDAGGLYAHAVLVGGLQTGVTYHYRVLSDDGTNAVAASGDFTVFLDPTGPVIDVWYGLDQTFGTIGLPQTWANVLGHVSDADGVSALSYRLNGGTPVALTIGPDGRRLEHAGDFNVDLAFAELDAGANTVEITAVDGASNVSVRTVTVNYDTGNVWPLPFDLDWDAVASVQERSQAVDGLWSFEGIGLRTAQPGYDRLVGIGHTSWDDYEVTVPITLDSLSPSAGGVGILLRWNGHTDNPIAGTQPKSGYLPLGCIGWYRNGRVELYGNGGQILDTDPRVLTQGLTYVFKMRVETVVGVGALYQLKVWEDGTPEPGAWDVAGQEQLSDPQHGSCLLISHLYDATFGDVSIVAVPGAPNVAPTANDDAFYALPGGTASSGVLANDVDSDGNIVPVTLDVTVPPANGTLFVNPTTGRFTYTHDGGPSISDEIRYTVEDNDGALSNEAVVSITVTNDPPPPFLSDDFGCGQDPSLWSFVNPLGDGSFVYVGTGTPDARLALSLPSGTEHDAWGAGGINEAARFMQAAENTDFELLVRWSAEPIAGFNDQGVIVEEDAANWLRFDVFHDGSSLKAFIGRTTGGSNVTVLNTVIASGTATHARVVRTGSTYTFELSNDGASWSLVGNVNQPLVVGAVGVYAANPVQALPFTSEVDYFFEAGAPIVPEDASGCFASFCDLGDGALFACPCGNPGDPETGCDLAQGTGGVGLAVLAQETSPGNAATLAGAGFPLAATPAAIVIRDSALELGGPVAFGDGVRCVGAPLVRLGAAFATAGTSTHVFGHGTMAGSGTFYYQLWFRNTPVMYCDPAAAFNLSSGRTLTW